MVGVMTIVVDCNNCEHSDNCDHIKGQVNYDQSKFFTKKPIACMINVIIYILIWYALIELVYKKRALMGRNRKEDLKKIRDQGNCKSHISDLSVNWEQCQ